MPRRPCDRGRRLAPMNITCRQINSAAPSEAAAPASRVLCARRCDESLATAFTGNHRGERWPPRAAARRGRGREGLTAVETLVTHGRTTRGPSLFPKPEKLATNHHYNNWIFLWVCVLSDRLNSRVICHAGSCVLPTPMCFLLHALRNATPSVPVYKSCA
jgi:hypothetical protein